jgi:hypothetical protein
MALKKLTELHLFNLTFATSLSDRVKDMTNEVLTTNFRVDTKDIADQLAVIQRRFKFISKSKIIADLEQGVTIPIFDPKLAIPSFIPTWLVYRDQDISAISNFTIYGKRADDGTLDIDNKKVYGLLQSASTVMALFQNQNKISNNATIIKNCTHAYVRMFIRCLDRAYSLNLQKDTADRVAYLVGKFFQVCVMGRPDGESTRAIALQSVSNDTPHSLLTRLDEEFTGPLDSLPGFIEALSQHFEVLRHLTLRTLVENWLRMYGDSTLLAIESFYYFLTTIFAAVTTSGLNNEVVINGLADKQIIAAHAEFFRLIK